MSLEQSSPSYNLPIHLKQIIGGSLHVHQDERTDFYDFSLITSKASLKGIEHVVEAFYRNRKFEQVPLSYKSIPGFHFRIYRHLSGSEVQVMIALEKSRFEFFVADIETDRQKSLRLALDSGK